MFGKSSKPAGAENLQGKGAYEAPQTPATEQLGAVGAAGAAGAGETIANAGAGADGANSQFAAQPHPAPQPDAATHPGRATVEIHAAQPNVPAQPAQVPPVPARPVQPMAAQPNATVQPDTTAQLDAVAQVPPVPAAQPNPLGPAAAAGRPNAFDTWGEPQAQPGAQPAPAAEGRSAKSIEREERRYAKAAAKADKAVRKAEKRAARKRPVKALAVGAGLVLIALGGAYAYGVNLYSKQFFPNTTFGPINVSSMTFEKAKEEFAKSGQEYVASVTGQGLDFKVTPVDVAMKFDGDGVVESAREAMNPLAWPVEIFSEHDLSGTAGISLDENLLSSFMKNQIDAFNGAHPASEDARIEYSSASHSFEVIPEVYGEQLDVNVAFETVKACMLSREAECAIPDKAVIQPAVKASDEEMVSGAKSANDLLGVDITLTSKLKKDGPAASLGSDKLAEWIVFDDKHQASLSDDAVARWAASVAAPLTNVGATRSYTRPDGKQVTIGGGAFGCSTSKDETIKAVREAIKEKKTGSIELATTCAGNQAPEGSPNEWGAYVDVDITEQRARFYNESGAVIWESGIISGNPTQGNATPGGIWFLNNKQPGTTLLGRMMPSGQREYETHVDYWMPFEGNLVGFHDASWQAAGNFGSPDAYRSVGSHGCVNLPPSAAASLYSLISVGTPVIVHG